MANLEKDLKCLHECMEGNHQYGEFAKIYPRTTESIKRVLEIVNLKGLDIYTVLSSSDILFSLLVSDVKSIRTFDINPLTYRYYYLRFWMLVNKILDGKDVAYEKIKEVINSGRTYRDRDEEESVYFWNAYLNSIRKYYEEIFDGPMDNESFRLYNATLFVPVGKRIECIYDERVDYLLECLKHYKMRFDEIDLLQDSIPEEIKVDVLYVSNIMDLHGKENIEKLKENATRILRPNGQIIGCNLITHPHFDFFTSQKQIFSKDYEYDELFIEGDGNRKSTYYRYIKNIK